MGDCFCTNTRAGEHYADASDSCCDDFANRRRFICFCPGAFIQVEQPWARATPAGASTGAIYLTIANEAHDADRLLGASSDVADKLQIHEMKVVNGVMEMREPISAAARSDQVETL